MTIRLDKYLTSCGVCSRSEASKAARAGKITVNGTVINDSSLHVNPDTDRVTFQGEALGYAENIYIMLNKPEGVVSATEDPKEKTVIDLLDDRLKKLGLFPCGRLDKNTLGLVILTNNGQAAHRRLSPKHHAEKEYRFKSRDALSPDDVVRLEQGVRIGKGYLTKPCRVRMEGSNEGVIVLTEGKYHQIKEMFGAIGNKIEYLERISFAGIFLDSTLARGAWRYLTEEEIKKMEAD